MLSLLSAIGQILSRLLGAIQTWQQDRDREKDAERGRLEEDAKQQTTKEHDEDVASRIDQTPVPADRTVVLGGLRAPVTTEPGRHVMG